MNQNTIIRLTGNFDLLGKNIPDSNITFWFAREIQKPLGYVRWENFLTAIKRAMTACESAGFSVNDHFRGVTKMADFLPTLTIAAKNLTTEMTNFNVAKDDMHGERSITNEHVANNASVRNMLDKRGIQPETLLPAGYQEVGATCQEG